VASISAPAAAAASLSDIYFDYDQFVLKPEARSALESNARLLQNGLTGPVVIEGHCDERGTHAYNMVLGERRAQAVKRFLMDLGVAQDRITIVSYGKERPFCTEHSEACWQENRRAHFLPR
jgi:peptidoglycan-associated lipoprotein